MDVLSDVIGLLGLQSSLYCRSELSAPWSLALPTAPLAHFHVIAEGACWLRLEGQSEALALASGDLVVVPHGRGHQLADSPVATPVPLAALLPDRQPGACHLLRHGGGGAATTLICGAFAFTADPGHPLLAHLPPVLHVRGAGGRVVDWLEPMLRFLAAETAQARPGGAIVVNRIVDVIFVQALRAWMDAQPEGSAGWVGALRDRPVATALERIHAAPDHAWTVAALAGEVGMSRSAFAARFTALVGEPPLAYLTRWRLYLAARWLRDDDRTLARIAREAGYGSEIAFSRAFKRRFGIAPGAYRRRARAA